MTYDFTKVKIKWWKYVLGVCIFLVCLFLGGYLIFTYRAALGGL